MTFTEQCITISLCALASMTTRFLPFLIFRPGKKLPAYIDYLGKALPSAIFALLVIYCLRNVNFMGGTYGIPEILSLVITVVLHIWKRNMMISMAAGTIAYMVLIRI